MPHFSNFRRKLRVVLLEPGRLSKTFLLEYPWIPFFFDGEKTEKSHSHGLEKLKRKQLPLRTPRASGGKR